MWYTRLYANTTFCSTAGGRRTGSPGNWAAVRQGMYRSSVPYPPVERRRAAHHHDCSHLTVQRPDGAQCDPRCSRPWPRRPPAHLLPAAYDPRPLRCRGARTAPGPRTPESPRVWPGYQCVDPGAGGRGQFCTAADVPTRQRRNHPHCHSPAGRPLEAGQARDHQPRAGVRPKKNVATA